MRNVPAAVGQTDGGGRAVADGRQALGQVGVARAQHPSRLKSRRGQDQPVGLETAAVLALNLPGRVVELHRAHHAAATNRAERQASHKRIDQLLHPMSEGHEQTPARPAGPLGVLGPVAPGPPQGIDQAAPLALHLKKARHGGRQAQLFRVGRVDAANQGLGDPLQGFPTEPSPDKRAEALIVLLGSARQNQIQAHPQLSRPGKEAGAHE